MRENVSALMDGELDDDGAQKALEAMKRDPQLHRTWLSYHLIGDALRRHPGLAQNYAERVLERLQGEPAIMARGALRQQSGPGRLTMSIAASLAGIGVVAWLAVSMNDQSAAPAQAVAVASPPPVAAAAPVVPASAALPSGALKEYLFAHQGYSPSSSIQGMAPYMRTVTEKRQATAQ